MAEGLGRSERVRRRAEFDRVHQEGVRVRGRLLTVLARPNCLPVARLGIAASRKLGGSVERNRAKRLIRELFRRNKLAVGLDLVIIPRVELLEAGFDSLENDFRSTLTRCVSRAGVGRPGRLVGPSRV